MNEKSNCLTTSNEFYQNYATACEFDENGVPTKATSCADGKKYDVYEVRNGQITIKGKSYPIKLADGYWIIRKLTVRECARLQTVPEWYEWVWQEYKEQRFGDEVNVCKSAKLKDAISQLQADKLGCVINTICGSLDMELRNLVENMSIITKNVKSKDAKESARLYKVTVSSTTKSGSEANQSMNQRNVLCVESQLDMVDATECVLSIIPNGCYTETLYITKKDNMNLMEMLGVNTTSHLTEDGFIGLLQKKYSEGHSNEEKLFIMSTLINWIMTKVIYMYATTKPTSICIDSLSDWQHHSLKTELLSLKMGNIGGVSNSAAYKCLGNGWTCEVIKHLMKSAMDDYECSNINY